MFKINYFLLPEHIQSSVQRYIEEGCPTGDFLKAVIQNKLKESFIHADETNTRRMWDIINFFYNEAPGDCWGSQSKMMAWIERGGLKGKGPGNM